MPDENLLKYIQDGLAMGRTEDVLRPLLQRAGWQQNDIEEAFRVVHGGAPVSTPAMSQPQSQSQPQIQPQVLQQQPQSQPQLQPQSAEVRQVTVGSDGGMVKWIAGGVIALIVVGGGAWAAYAFFVPPSPQQVLDAMFQKGFSNINSMDMDMAIAADFKTTPAAAATSSGIAPPTASPLSLMGGAANPLAAYASMFVGGGPSEVKVSLDASGTAIVNPANMRSGDENIAAGVTVDREGQSVSFSGSGEVRALPFATYFKIAAFPNFGFFNPAMLEGRWIEIPAATSSAGVAPSFTVPSSTLSAPDAARLASAAESMIKITKTLPDETIGGISSYHYAYTIDPAGVNNLVDAAVQAANDEAAQQGSSSATIDASATAQMKDQANAALAAFETLGGEIWIGKSDHYPHQVTFEASFSTSTPAYGSVVGTVNVTTTATNINGGQVVTVPENAETITQFFASMMTSGIQGASGTLGIVGNNAGSAGNTGSTGGASIKPYPAELLAQGRDANRISDLATLKSAIALYAIDTPNPNFACANTKTIYASAPITPPPGWKAGAHMGSTAVNGTGWLPIDFASISSGPPIAKLPVDPANNPAEHLVYLFACDPAADTYELDAVMESKKYSRGGSGDVESTDGGNDPNVYEVGTNLKLIPDNFWQQ